jgi:hypothetical protein
VFVSAAIPCIDEANASATQANTSLFAFMKNPHGSIRTVLAPNITAGVNSLRRISYSCLAAFWHKIKESR